MFTEGRALDYACFSIARAATASTVGNHMLRISNVARGFSSNHVQLLDQRLMAEC